MKKIFFFLLLPLSLQGQDYNIPLIDSLMQANVAIKQFNGNVLIAKSDKIIYQKAFGYRNYYTRELLDNNSVFELASISKQFTAMGILLLQQKGLLGLTDSLRMFFPELPYYNITIKHLLTHTSGLPDYYELMSEKWDLRKIAFSKDVLNLLIREKPPVIFNPGEGWEYCNTAYVLLGLIIENVSSLSLKNYMEANIFGPLEMEHSFDFNTMSSSDLVLPNYAYGFVYSDSLNGYVIPDSLPEYDLAYYLEGIQGDGTINSTTGDLLKWQIALNNHTLLEEQLQKEMLSPQSIEDTARQFYYGYGTEIGRDEVGNYYGHRGYFPGYWTNLKYYPEHDLTLVLLCNNDLNIDRLAEALAYVLTGRPVSTPCKHKPESVDTSVLSTYAGEYLIQDIPLNTRVDLFVRNGRLFYKLDLTKEGYKWTHDSEVTELVPASSDKFFVEKGPDVLFEFKLSPSCEILEAWFVYYSLKKKMTRLL